MAPAVTTAMRASGSGDLFETAGDFDVFDIGFDEIRRAGQNRAAQRFLVGEQIEVDHTAQHQGNERQVDSPMLSRNLRADFGRDHQNDLLNGVHEQQDEENWSGQGNVIGTYRICSQASPPT